MNFSEVHHSHPSRQSTRPMSCPVSHGDESTSSEKCPVDHSSRQKWASMHASSSTSAAHPLPMDRETSSIPRADGSGNWVYPSQSQFYEAMARKNHNPTAGDMKVVVPIHNAVNERTWAEVLKWETGQGGEKCGGIKLISFKGNAGKLTPKARFKMLFGYSRPFDRHDWVVDRCGTRVRYVIDFYTGRSETVNSSPTGNTSFYLDVRPALDNFEGVKMRMSMFFNRWFSPASTSSPTTAATAKSS